MPMRADSCEIWAPSQTLETAHENIMKPPGLPSEAVKVHTTLLGGGFGRRLFVDYVDEAVELSKAIGKPVQIVWTRDDDMRNGFFHPALIEKLSTALAGGRILAWRHRFVGSSPAILGALAPSRKAGNVISKLCQSQYSI